MFQKKKTSSQQPPSSSRMFIPGPSSPKSHPVFLQPRLPILSPGAKPAPYAALPSKPPRWSSSKASGQRPLRFGRSRFSRDGGSFPNRKFSVPLALRTFFLFVYFFRRGLRSGRHGHVIFFFSLFLLGFDVCMGLDFFSQPDMFFFLGVCFFSSRGDKANGRMWTPGI